MAISRNFLSKNGTRASTPHASLHMKISDIRKTSEKKRRAGWLVSMTSFAKCGIKNHNFTLSDRVFKCANASCGHVEDRDIQAAVKSLGPSSSKNN
jgi:hypothetical protein